MLEANNTTTDVQDRAYVEPAFVSGSRVAGVCTVQISAAVHCHCQPWLGKNFLLTIVRGM